ncbi:MAG: hypothetical protein ACKOBC_09225 [Hyphomicrobiales bacterium]
MRFVLFAALLVVCVSPSLSYATETTFVVPADDGYGMDDCLAEGKACAKLVADSWCQVKGMSVAVRFERASAEDITASLTSKAAVKPSETAYLITCRN